MSFFSQFSFQEFVSAFLVLFAAIDVLGVMPVILNMKKKGSVVDAKRCTLYSAIMLFAFFYIGEAFLSLFGLDISAFAIAGSLVIFCIGMEMILDVEIFKSGGPRNNKDATFIPVTFPLLAGAGVLTTLLSIRSQYHDINMLLAIILNIGVIAFVMYYIEKIGKILGPGILYMMQKFFGVILLAIAIKLFVTNVTLLVDKIS